MGYEIDEIKRRVQDLKYELSRKADSEELQRLKNDLHRLERGVSNLENKISEVERKVDGVIGKIIEAVESAEVGQTNEAIDTVKNIMN